MRLIVMCPDGLVTGGAEALHQLVDSARSQKIDASISYYPPGRREVVPQYQHYDIEVTSYVPDASDVLVVGPETAPQLLLALTRARKALWWLSIDNFFDAFGIAVSEPNADPELLRGLCSGELGVVHVTQSHYAREFLNRRGVRSKMLTDYLSGAFEVRAVQLQSQPKKDLILYNPRKGLAFTQRLIDASRSTLEWQPIEGLDADGVADLLGSAKLYVDFGQHPGRDRIPREAALAGCCVVTGRRGAAGHASDLPIPERFRMDDSSPDLVGEFIELAADTIERFDEVRQEFDDYRAWILGQRQAFHAETAELWRAAWAPRFKGAPIGRSKSKRKR